MRDSQWRRGLKRVGAGSCNFPTDSCQILDGGDVHPEDFNFVHEFSPNWGYFAQNVVFFRQKFSNKSKIF